MTLVPTHSAKNAEWMGHPPDDAKTMGGVHSLGRVCTTFMVGGWQRQPDEAYYARACLKASEREDELNAED